MMEMVKMKKNIFPILHPEQLQNSITNLVINRLHFRELSASGMEKRPMVSFGPGNFSAFRYYFALLELQRGDDLRRGCIKWARGKFVPDGDT